MGIHASKPSSVFPPVLSDDHLATRAIPDQVNRAPQERYIYYDIPNKDKQQMMITTMIMPWTKFVIVATLVCILTIHRSLADNECSSNPCVNGTCLDDHYGYYTCVCAHGYHGTNCEAALPKTPDDELCYFSITDPVTMVTSPGFPAESAHNTVCYYIIRIHGAKNIRVTFNALNTEWLKDVIYLGTGNNASESAKTHTIMGEIGANSQPDIIFSASSIFMIYETDHNIISEGFNATIEADFDDCMPSPCQNGGTCSDRFLSFDCACPPSATGTQCETDVISFSSATPAIVSGDDVTLPSSTQQLNLIFNLELTPSSHSANPHLVIQSTSTTPSWTVTAYLSQDENGDGERFGEVEVPLRKEQSDVSLANHMTFRDVTVSDMRIPESVQCSDVGYFCAIFNPNNDSPSSSSMQSSPSPSQSADYLIRGDPDSSVFVGCSPIQCKESPRCEGVDCRTECAGEQRCNEEEEGEEEMEDNALSDEDEADQVGLGQNSTWDHPHTNIILLVIVGIVCTALIIIVILVLFKGRDKIKLMFIHSPSAPSTSNGPVIRWITPPTNSNISQAVSERGDGVQGIPDGYFGIVNEGASSHHEESPAPPYSEVAKDNKI
ncbi:protein eyes shut-like [Lytechinus variegatus]|uniref:protein eyes shut-like n=1 Tax=Lytechinus variegatus TaxID=7654 RepID=UPI001BB25B22|nr:protein eyes shut-like [Lytechinus variegatus]